MIFPPITIHKLERKSEDQLQGMHQERYLLLQEYSSLKKDYRDVSRKNVYSEKNGKCIIAIGICLHQ